MFCHVGCYLSLNSFKKNIVVPIGKGSVCFISIFLHRLQSAEKQAEKSNREYQMGKIDALRAEVDEATKKFEDCQDAYATELFTFMSKEQLYTEKLQEVGWSYNSHPSCLLHILPLSFQFVRRQVSMLKQGVASLEGMLPTIEKKMSKAPQDSTSFLNVESLYHLLFRGVSAETVIWFVPGRTSEDK